MKSRTLSAKAFKLDDPIPKPNKVTQPEKVIEYLITHEKIAGCKINKAINLSAHTAEILGYLETNGMIKGTPCECGKDRIYSLNKSL